VELGGNLLEDVEVLVAWSASTAHQLPSYFAALENRSKSVADHAGLIRLATESEVPCIERIVHEAYECYIPRIGRAPGPMTDNYYAHVAQGNVWVLTISGKIVGVLVLLPKADHMLLDNVAVSPERQGLGLGRQLIEFAEALAKQSGFMEIWLYTNTAMHENLAMYLTLGYQEFARGLQDGFHRVFMEKALY
jgi:N-acetylglutamate synthase-like GNAT family acetyltransferase